MNQAAQLKLEYINHQLQRAKLDNIQLHSIILQLNTSIRDLQQEKQHLLERAFTLEQANKELNQKLVIRESRKKAQEANWISRGEKQILHQTIKLKQSQLQQAQQSINRFNKECHRLILQTEEQKRIIEEMGQIKKQLECKIIEDKLKMEAMEVKYQEEIVQFQRQQEKMKMINSQLHLQIDLYEKQNNLNKLLKYEQQIEYRGLGTQRTKQNCIHSQQLLEKQQMNILLRQKIRMLQNELSGVKTRLKYFQEYLCSTN